MAGTMQDIPYRLLGGAKPTLACTPDGFIAAAPQSEDVHRSCLQFNGAGDSARLPADLDLGIGNEWSVMLWVLPTQLEPSDTETLFEIHNLASSGDDTNSFRIDIEPFDTLIFRASNSGGVTFKRFQINSTESGLTGIDGWFHSGTWSQIVVTWDGSDFNMYRNGYLMNSAMTAITDIAGSQTNTDRSISIGSRVDLTNPFTGFMHSVAYWREALPQGAIRQIWNHGCGSTFNLNIGVEDYGPAPAEPHNVRTLEAWWQLGKDLTAPVVDWSGNAKDLGVFATLGDNVVRFSPDGSYFTTSGILGLENTTSQPYDTAQSHSCGVWVRPASLPGSGLDADVFRIADDQPLGRFRHYWYHRNEIRIGLLEDGAGTVNWTYTITATSGSPPDTMIVVGTSPVEVGKWYHVLGCKNDTYSARLFINGVSETLELVGVPPSNNNTKKSGIGFDTSPADSWISPDHPHGNFDGDIHSIALWNTAISDEAVRSVYGGGWKDVDLRDDRNPGYNDAINLVHWWRLGQGVTDTHSAGNEFVADWIGPPGLTGIYMTEQEGVIEQSDILKVGEAPAGTSVDFDGASSMSTPTAVPLGIVDEWTVSAWIKPREVLTTGSDIIYIGPDSGGANSIQISQNGDIADDPLVVTVKDSAGTTIFAHEYNTVLSEDEWQHVGVTWDGASLNTYLDGSLLSPDVVGAGAGVAQADSSRDILLGEGPLTAAVPFPRQNCIEVDHLDDSMIGRGVSNPSWGGANWSIAGWIKPSSTTPLVGSDLGIFDESTVSTFPGSVYNNNRKTIKFVEDGGGLWTLYVQIWDTDGLSSLIWEYSLGTTDIEDILTNGMNQWNFFCLTYNESLSGVGNILTMYMNGSEITATSTTGSSITSDTSYGVDRYALLQWGNTGKVSGVGYFENNIMAGRFHRLGLWNVTLASAEQSVLYNSDNPPEIGWSVNSGSYTSSADLEHYYEFGEDNVSATGPFDYSALWLFDRSGSWLWDLDGDSFKGAPDVITGDPLDSRPPVGGSTNPWKGKMGHVGIWNEALSAEAIRTVFAKGQQLDLRYDVDAYSGAESLQSYFKPGEDSTLLGRNFIDMNRSAANKVLTLITGTLVPEGDSPTSPFVAPVLGESRSVSLDGVSEFFAHTIDLAIGIADTWSVSLWANKRQLLVDRQLLLIHQTPGGTDNVISLEATGSADLECIIRDSGGTIIKQHAFNGVFASLDVWRHIAFTWNGTLLDMYIDGVFTNPDLWTIDIPGTMTDTNRSVLYGESDVLGAKPFPGYLGHLGIWNTVLAAGEVTEIFNNAHALDLKTDYGAYVSSASLLHYWRPGYVDVGFTDEQASPASIDFDDSVDLDASDIVNDAP